MAKKKKNREINYIKKKNREAAIADGAYDGRFSPKVVPDKKKKTDKEKARKKINPKDY